MRAVKKKLKLIIKSLRTFIAPIQYYGRKRFCPLCCKTSSRFRSFGVVPREEAQCVHCGALERHRFLWEFLNRRTNLFDGEMKVLHVAPESCLEVRLIKRLGCNYLTADLFNPSAMVKMDVCNIPYPECSFDVIICSHVLEHVLDDRKAMREFYRVLNVNGWAILNVPIDREKTYEDSSIILPNERLKAFGQKDHVRCYGQDYVYRLRDSGFNVDIVKVNNLVDGNEAVKMGLTRAVGEIYYCTK